MTLILLLLYVSYTVKIKLVNVLDGIFDKMFFVFLLSWNRSTTTQKTEVKQMVNGNRTSKFQEQKKVTVPPIKSQRYLSDVAQNEGNKDKDNTPEQGNRLCDGKNEQIHPSETTNGVNA